VYPEKRRYNRMMGHKKYAFSHIDKAVHSVSYILLEFGFSEREVEMARIAEFIKCAHYQDSIYFTHSNTEPM